MISICPFVYNKLYLIHHLNPWRKFMKQTDHWYYVQNSHSRFTSSRSKWMFCVIYFLSAPFLLHTLKGNSWNLAQTFSDVHLNKGTGRTSISDSLLRGQGYRTRSLPPFFFISFEFLKTGFLNPLDFFMPVKVGIKNCLVHLSMEISENAVFVIKFCRLLLYVRNIN